MKKEVIALALERIAAIASVNQRIEELQKMANPAVLDLFRYAFNPVLVFLLPEGADVPYKPGYTDEAGPLYSQIRKLYMFVEGGHPTLKQKRRETLWVDLLESVHPADAILLNLIKDKKCTPGITKATVLKAFPDLF